MVRITVNAETAEAIRTSEELVSLYDGAGECLGYVMPPLSDEQHAAIKRRLSSDGPWYTTPEVIDHLHCSNEED